MNAHIEIKIRLRQLPQGGLHEVLKTFCEETKGWHFPQEQSQEYQQHNGRPAGFAACVDFSGLEPAAVAIASLDPKQPSTFRVPNIVPRACSSLTLQQYNEIGSAFANLFQDWLKQSSLRGNIKTIGPNRTLADIIPGEKNRKLFEAWLHTPTPISHPSDVHALDRFICHLFRHRGKTRTWEIEPYLVDDLQWKPEAARWVVARIETGLELLRIDRKF
ncbi:MAG: hypothetical protein QOG67_100 [Verrucomicrobiota bacterium]